MHKFTGGMIFSTVTTFGYITEQTDSAYINPWEWQITVADNRQIGPKTSAAFKGYFLRLAFNYENLIKLFKKEASREDGRTASDATSYTDVSCNQLFFCPHINRELSIQFLSPYTFHLCARDRVDLSRLVACVRSGC